MRGQRMRFRERPYAVRSGLPGAQLGLLERLPAALAVARTRRRAEDVPRRAYSASSVSTSSARRVSSPKWSSSLPAETRAGRPVSRSAAARARSASAGSTGVARGRRRAPPSWAARSVARTVRPSRATRRARRVRASSSGTREHRAGVALGQLAAGEHPEHLLGKLEQPQPVRDAGLRAADPLGDLAERELELVDQRRRRRGPPRPARGSRGRRSRRARGGACRGRRSRGRGRAGSRGRPRGRRASGARRRRARSRPRGAGGRRSAAGRPGGEATRRGRRSPPARTAGAAGARSGGSRRAGRWRRSLPPAGAADEHLEAAAEAAARSGGLRCARQAPSPPSSRPRRRRSGGRRRSREARGSAPRRGAPSGARSVVKTRSPKCERSSRSTSSASRVRAVDHRQQDPRDAEARVEPPLDEVDRAEQLREALERVVLRLHGDDHAVGGGERVHRERAERRRAVEEDEAVARSVASSRERVGEVALAALERGQVHRRRGELGLRGDEVEVRERARRRRAPPAASPSRRSSVEWPFARRPSPEVAFACGSRSTIRQRSPASARQAARLTAVVVLPTPPFWFAIA